MHMSLSSILGTDLHMIKPLQALDPMVRFIGSLMYMSHVLRLSLYILELLEIQFVMSY